MTEENEESEGEEGGEFAAEMESFVEGVAGLFDNLKEIFVKSKEEVVRGAQLGKVRIDVFQLRKDREHFMQRLGEECYDLLVAGTVEHADLSKPFEKIRALDARIVEYEEEIAELAAQQAAAGVANEEGEPATAEPAAAEPAAAEPAAEEPAAAEPAAEEPAAEEPKVEKKPAPKKAAVKKKPAAKKKASKPKDDKKSN